MKEKSNVIIGLRRDRRARGVTVKPAGTETVYNGCSRAPQAAAADLEGIPEALHDVLRAADAAGITAESVTREMEAARAAAEAAEDAESGGAEEASADAAGSAAAGRPRRHQWKRLNKKQRRVWYAAVSLICILSCISAAAWSVSPCAVTINGEPVCYLSDMKEASSMMLDLAKDSSLGSDVKAVDVGEAIAVKKAFGFNHEIKTADEAAEFLKDNYLQTGKAELTTASIASRIEKFTPAADIREDNTMLAGTERLESMSESGVRVVTTEYTSTNGKKDGGTVIDEAVIDKGSPAVIYRGTIGLPEGADYKTYDGPPVLENGEEMIKLAKKYLGLRYVYGGNSLETGVDCVTFVINIYKKFGIKIPHTYEGIKKGGVAVSMDQAQAGDVIVYNGHVALYMGNGKIIHATRGKSWNVHISNVNYSKKRHIQTIRRFVN